MASTSEAPKEPSLARRLWLAAGKEAALSAYSPFIICLASGTLKVESFRHYIEQDVHFLRAFSRAYDMVEEYIVDAGDKAAVAELRKAVVEELKLHSSVIHELNYQGLNVDASKEVRPSLATLRYIKFLEESANGKIGEYRDSRKPFTFLEKIRTAAYALSSMVPCMRLYTFLGQEVQIFTQLRGSSHPYRKWIDNYSSSFFEDSTFQIEELLNKLSIILNEEDEVIRKMYNQAMRHEVEFFYCQPIMQQTVAPLIRLADQLENRLLFFSDFDLVCSSIDSCNALADTATKNASRYNPMFSDPTDLQKLSTDLKKSWNAHSGQFSSDYEQCIESILTVEEGNVEGFNYKSLYKALETLSSFEKGANSGVIASGVLKDLNLSDIENAGSLLYFQNGFIDFIEQIVEKEILADLHVFSLCMCADLIRAAFSAGGFHTVNVHSNELRFEGGVSTGDFSHKLDSLMDKIETFRKVLKESRSRGRHLSVYIGDSVDDLLCLLEADIGIVFGTDSRLRRVGARFGVSFVPLFSGLLTMQKQLADEGCCFVLKGLSGTIFTVSSWCEVHAFILGV